jgi:hypothetical protein
MDEQKVRLPVILRIFDENQNPADMHTSIMCKNILQNIKAVAGVSRTNHVPFMQLVRKLYEEIAGQTMYLYPNGRTDGRMDG